MIYRKALLKILAIFLSPKCSGLGVPDLFLIYFGYQRILPPQSMLKKPSSTKIRALLRKIENLKAVAEYNVLVFQNDSFFYFP